MEDREYYRLSKKEIEDRFQTSFKKGISSREARRRQFDYGPNHLKETNGRGIIHIFLSQFQDFMIMVLMFATILSFLLGEISDGFTILAIIVLNAIMGFIQEYRAEKSLEALKKLTAPKTKVIRNGKIQEINARELVPGDIIMIETGDRIPADARIIDSTNLQVDESLLTGESVAVDKSSKNITRKNLALGNQTNMVFMGTTVTRGKARAVVVNTGMETEMGKIASLINNNNDKELTPLQKRLKHLGKWLVFLSVFITMLIVVIGVLKGQSIYQMFLAGVSLAVAAIPEGLPAIVTLALAIGVQKMIKNNAIVRRLPAVETLGCATVICSDKTGTLTENKMEMTKIYLNRKIMKFKKDLKSPGLKKLLMIGALCNGAQPAEEEKSGPFKKIREFISGNQVPSFLGDPTDVALVRAIYKYGLSLRDLKTDYEVLKEEPFNSVRKRMSVLIKDTSTNKRQLWVKGAPEVILSLSDYVEINGNIQRLTKKARKEILKANDRMAEDGLRVLAIAYRDFSDRARKKDLTRYEDKLIILGLVGLIDPPRPEAYRAVESCYRAGIRPVMITGDHKITARVIAEDLGIISRGGRVLTGNELKQVSNKQLKGLVKEIQVYARISPEDKLRIVKALKENNEIVAMTGDGVNDAPAVKEADIGIAMGAKGTDVTKEVSSLILADDNFATIVKAIKEGRKIYNNIRKFIRYLLSCNIGEILAIFLGITLGLPIPLLPIQILWVNLVTDGLPALALGMEDDGEDVMEKPPRDPDESVFAHGMVSNITSQGFLIGISTMLAFLLAVFKLNLDINTARTMAFSTLVFSQLFFVFNCRSEERPFWNMSPFSNPYLFMAVLISLVMQLGVIYLPFLSKFFKTTVLNPEQWLIVIVLSTWSTIFLEIIRGIINNYKRD
ncbi:calcium-transporting P-type ATPase, PMR1-type [Halothermothrix orenii]|uniref:P-type Ca(2+) transporter n=1 Tax=Halothermothrix orenii (strain H 168 / OCM 544 / DSM 9562) TaxID=373903 RepID=B8CWR6_HALOH|nr:calcium-transporting P-type ATPase, PMR1-type [Halothermothrix orenii]ACL69735.1 calcium-translocating P-type ATPase, PMCA-type [Halothermothrix orenii H 168]